MFRQLDAKNRSDSPLSQNAQFELGIGPLLAMGDWTRLLKENRIKKLGESHQARVLYVEDDAETRKLVSYVLARAGYEVVVTENPEHAVLLAQTTSFDLYLIDNWMPGASGIELCGWLRKFDKDTPILFYSGAAYEQDKQDALAASAQGYLTKPADIDKLLEEVSRLISDARRSRIAGNLVQIAASGYLGM